MIGIIAGEIIGSPYRQVNLENITDIFFPLFEPQVVMDRKTYKERTYRPDIGSVSNVALNFDDMTDLSYINRENVGEILAAAIVLGDMAAAAKSDFDTHSSLTGEYARWFPEELHKMIDSASSAAYRLRRDLSSDIRAKLGTALNKPFRAEILSALLKGQLADDGEGAYIPGEGKYNDRYILDAAYYAIESSSSYEEAVRRATALGGNSASVAAITGGLAELAFGVPEKIAFKAMEMLDREQTARLQRYEAAIRLFSGGDQDSRQAMSKLSEGYTEISVLSLPGKSRIYAIPEGRTDIENAIRRINRDSIFVRTDGMRKIIERLSRRQDSEGNPLAGTFIDSARPEVRHLYFYHKDGKPYSASTLPIERRMGFASLDERLKTRSDFMRFIQKAESIRDEQERKVGHNPEEGHLRFASAWYLQIERDRIVLMKGDTPYGEFGLDDRGRMKVNTNVIGGRFGSEYLQGALDNRRVFYASDSEHEILAKISEKCLDDGYMPNPDRPVPSNLELMLNDLSMVHGDLRKAVEVSDDILKERSSDTKLQMNYAASSEVTSIDQAVFSKAHAGAVFTIGHSNLSIEAFVGNCKRNGITMVRDVRSWPYSKNYPHFNREELKTALEAKGITYVYNGDTMGGHIRRNEYPAEADGVTFTLSVGGYAERTRENARVADLTIAFAADFNTAGEKITAEAAHGKIIQVPLDGQDVASPKEIAKNITSCMTSWEKAHSLVINIAGNDISTLERHGISQSTINATVTGILKEMANSGIRIRKIISGGQTGADEAGIIAAKSLGIPAEVHAPKGWLMRGPDGRDTFSEYDFKSRFAVMPDKDLSYREMMDTPGFRGTYDEIVHDARNGVRQAIMCTETSPTNCHRFACIGFALEHPAEAGRRYSPTEVHHIKRDGQTIPQSALERKLCKDKRMEYSEANVTLIMRQVGERIQHPKDDDRPISLKRNQSRQCRR